MSLYAKICTQNVCVVVVIAVVVVSGESFSYCVGLTKKKKKIIIIINRKRSKKLFGVFLFLLLVFSFKISRIDQNSERPYNLRHPNY